MGSGWNSGNENFTWKCRKCQKKKKNETLQANTTTSTTTNSRTMKTCQRNNNHKTNSIQPAKAKSHIRFDIISNAEIQFFQHIIDSNAKRLLNRTHHSLFFLSLNCAWAWVCAWDVGCGEQKMSAMKANIHVTHNVTYILVHWLDITNQLSRNYDRNYGAAWHDNGPSATLFWTLALNANKWGRILILTLSCTYECDSNTMFARKHVSPQWICGLIFSFYEFILLYMHAYIHMYRYSYTGLKKSI